MIEFDIEPREKEIEFDVPKRESIVLAPPYDDTEIKEDLSQLSQLMPEANPTVGKVLKVLAVNEDGTFTCEWADGGSGGVDVQINGTSITHDGVANIPAAANGERGVVSVNKYGSYGLSVGSYGGAGGLSIQNASTSEIDKRASAFFPVTPNVLPYAVKSVMTAPVSTTDPAWLAEEQAAAHQRMGFQTITQEEYDLLETKDASTYYFIVDGDAT